MALLVHYYQVKLEFRMLVIVEGRKLDELEKNAWSKDKDQQPTQPQVHFRKPLEHLKVHYYQIILLGGDKHHEGKVSCPRTRHNDQAKT